MLAHSHGYTLAAEFYIQDVMYHVKVLIYKVFPGVLHWQCLPLHPGCNGHVKENFKNALHEITCFLHLFTSNVIDYMRFHIFHIYTWTKYFYIVFTSILLIKNLYYMLFTLILHPLHDYYMSYMSYQHLCYGF